MGNKSGIFSCGTGIGGIEGDNADKQNASRIMGEDSVPTPLLISPSATDYLVSPE
jgi:hypothetical protein